MKESDSNGRQSSVSKKANINNDVTAINLKKNAGRLTNKMLSTSNGTIKSKTMGSNHSSTKSSPTIMGSKQNKNKKGRTGSNKQSPEMRPRRRASQTYFFKYQLARNPLKAEEEDLKMALLASLQQCNDNDNDNNNNHLAKKKSKTVIKTNANVIKANTGKNVITKSKTKKPSKVVVSDETSSSNSNSDATSIASDSSTLTLSGNSSSSKNDISDAQTLTSNSITPESDNNSIHYMNETNKPETEDFLTFICLRTTASNYQSNDTNNNNHTSSNHMICTTPTKTNNQDTHNRKGSTQQSILNSPLNNGRRPIRQSPRLASSNQRKISENNDTSNTIITAYDNSITYEEDMKRASVALEEMMAQETEDTNDHFCSSHKVEALISSRFAGHFADEETIFESISNHKL